MHLNELSVSIFYALTALGGIKARTVALLCISAESSQIHSAITMTKRPKRVYSFTKSAGYPRRMQLHTTRLECFDPFVTATGDTRLR